MLLQKQHKLTITIRALVICILGIGTWSYQSDAYGMGYSQKIEGKLLHEGRLLVPDDEPYGIQFDMGRSRCVLFGVSSTGYGVKAISYDVLHTACYLYRIVDDVVSAGANWCSQWVFPTNSNSFGGDECYRTGGGRGSGEALVSWEPEPITFPAGEFCGGGPSYSIYEDFKIIVICGPAPSGH